MGSDRLRIGRILVVARPHDGRPLAAILRRAGYEVHRTPSDADLVVLVARLRPHLVIVVLGIPWGDAVSAVHPLLERAWPGPLLLLGEASGDTRVQGVPRLPLPVDEARLLATVHRLCARATPPART